MYGRRKVHIILSPTLYKCTYAEKCTSTRRLPCINVWTQKGAHQLVAHSVQTYGRRKVHINLSPTLYKCMDAERCTSSCRPPCINVWTQKGAHQLVAHPV